MPQLVGLRVPSRLLFFSSSELTFHGKLPKAKRLMLHQRLRRQLHKQDLKLRQVRLFWANNLLVRFLADLLKKRLKHKLAKHLLSKA